MNYSEFFQCFYISRTEGGLIGYKSQKKIPEFFFRYGLEEDFRGVLPTSDSAYEKYFNAWRSPRNDLWEALNGHFDADGLLKKLLRELNESKLRELMKRFGIVPEEQEIPDKRRFARALVAQFEALAAGGGSAENTVPAEYKKTPEPAGFEAYLRSACDKLRWMKIPGGEERLLGELFVPGNIGTSSAVFPNRIRGKHITNPTLRKILTFDRRGEMRHVILIGACGYGKTLMMQHLFLEAAESRGETGLLPVFAVLREFRPDYDDFVAYLVDAVKEFDLSFTYEMAVDLLEKGQMQILLDGLDEMNPLETTHFQRKLADLCQHYPNNQVVISSRQCAALHGIRRFNSLYIHPLDEEQSQELIDRLLTGIEDEHARETVQSFFGINSGLVRWNGFVGTNPMLLSIIVRHYKEISDLHGGKVRFFELLYNGMIREHDEEKEAFARYFHSVGSCDEFTDAFRGFCAFSYMDGMYEFDHRSFEKYFRKVRTNMVLQNPAIFTLTNFQHDVCATACMMYEQESDLYYIDPGFQDYFFADYYFYEDTEPTRQMGRALWHRDSSTFRNLDALKMFCEIDRDKAEVCILLPYLETIFRGQPEEEAFLRYQEAVYGDTAGANPDSHTGAPRNIVMELIQDILHAEGAAAAGAPEESQDGREASPEDRAEQARQAFEAVKAYYLEIEEKQRENRYR